MAYHLKYKGPAIDERLDLAGTALQEHQNISHLATKEEVAKGLDAKEDVIEDLEEIRSGAKLGSTSIQEHQDISHLASKTDVSSGLNKKVDKVDGKGLSTEDYTTAEKQKLAALDTTIKQAVDELQVEVARKQDSIEDLEEIREGASKGATALQEHQDISNLATKEEVSNGLDNKVDKIDGKGLSTEDFTTTLKAKLQGLNNYDDTSLSEAISSLQEQFNLLVVGNPSDAINSFNEIVAFLDGVQDTEDLSSIIASIEQQIAGKQDKIDDLETIRSGAAKGATALQSYTEKYTGTITGITMNGASKGTSGVVNLGTVITEHQDISGKADKSSLATVATSGSYNDLSNKPTIPSEQVNADWNATSGKAQILNKPTIPAAVTESTVSGWGFTKNTGTYSKPSGGIPKSDLASAVQTSLGKADSALQSIPSEYITESELNEKGYATTSELTSGLSEKASIAQVESMIAEAITNTLNTEV